MNPPAVAHMLLKLVVLGALLSCTTFGRLTPGTPSETGSGSRPAPSLNPAPETLIAAESAVWEDLRSPLQEVIGSTAADTYQAFDRARTAIANQAAQTYIQDGASLRRSPGLSQRGITAAGLVSLIPAVTSMIGRTQTANSQPFTQDSDVDGVGVKLTVQPHLDGDTLRMEGEMSLEGTTGGQALREESRITADIKVCPDGLGRVPVTLDLTMASSAVQGTTTYAEQMHVSGQAMGQVSDDAELVSYATDVTAERSSQFTDTSDPKAADNQYGEASTHSDTDVSQASQTYHTQVTRTSSKATQAIVDSASRISQNLLDGLIASWFRTAQELWQHGYCVEVVPKNAADLNEVDASSATVFTAAVRHKFDGNELTVPLQAAFSGAASVSPTEKGDAPVSYTYVAPEDEGSGGTVSLTTRSRRGVATKEISFVVKATAYHPIAPPYQWSGVVCDLGQPFSLSHSGESVGSYAFTPADDASGALTMTQTVGPCTLTASGSYVVEKHSGGRTEADLIMDVSGSMQCPGSTVPVDTQLRILLEAAPEPTCH